ncbi:MAG: hypothetical protein ACXVCY_03215 [Pseudobdellovibrionaceae bacterium]
MLSIKLFKNILFSLTATTLFTTSIAAGSACCGGGISIPTIITGDDKQILTTSLAESTVDTFVGSDGIWRKTQDQDRSFIFRLDIARIFSENFQIGVSLPFQERTKTGLQGGNSAGLSDISGQIGYEFMPDKEYNLWKPHGVGYVSLVVPTGKSVYDVKNSGSPEVSGRGLWSLGVGAVFTKYWIYLDAITVIEAHQYLDRTFSNDQLHGTVSAGRGYSSLIGLGFNSSNYRLGASISWIYEDPIEISGLNSSTGSLQRFATGTLSVSRMMPEQMGVTVSYSDQMLFGDPTNTALSRSVLISLQKKWER